jgi:hypothetical protein
MLITFIGLSQRGLSQRGLSQRGLPQQRFAPYLAVTEQLWTGEPPEIWAAARRILDAKLSVTSSSTASPATISGEH